MFIRIHDLGFIYYQYCFSILEALEASKVYKVYIQNDQLILQIQNMQKHENLQNQQKQEVQQKQVVQVVLLFLVVVVILQFLVVSYFIAFLDSLINSKNIEMSLDVGLTPLDPPKSTSKFRPTIHIFHILSYSIKKSIHHIEFMNYSLCLFRIYEIYRISSSLYVSLEILVIQIIFD